MTGLACLVLAIYFEARGEPEDGQVAVAEVVMNRVEDPRYPNTICGVVNQPQQFSFMSDGKSEVMLNSVAKEKATTIANKVISGYRLGITSTHYHTVDVNPKWAKKMELDGIIGRHLFYTNETIYR